MKTIRIIIAIVALSIFAMSCTKDDEPTTVKPTSAEASFENITEVNILDATISGGNINVVTTPKSTESNIEVTATGTILDLKKLVLEMNIQHNKPSDLSFTLVAPDGTESLFVKRVGVGDFWYFANRKLRFSASFSDVLPSGSSIIAGNYKESQGIGAFATPLLLPIFSTFRDSNITGTWKLKATDSRNTITGKIKSWKLIFEAGALNQ